MAPGKTAIGFAAAVFLTAFVGTSAGDAISDEIPAPGGTAAIAAALQIDSAPDRARFVAELVRIVYSAPLTGSHSTGALTQRLAAYFAERLRNPRRREGDEDVPVPLPAEIWSRDIFESDIDRGNLLAAILGNRRAALLCHGLAGLDDSTLAFLAAHPSLLKQLYRRSSGTFAAFGDALHIQGDRVLLPGAPESVAVWEASVGETIAQPDRFVPALFERDNGRVAYVLSVLSTVDSPTRAFALGSWMPDDKIRVERFRRLVNVASHAFPEWDATTMSFSRPPYDLATLLERVRAAPNGGPIGVVSRQFWKAALSETRESKDGQTSEPPIDAAWLAEAILPEQTATREARLNQVGFAMRLFVEEPSQGSEVVRDAIQGVARFPALMLTLERMGILTPATYAAAGTRARQVSSVDGSEGYATLTQFQGALALIARLKSVHFVDEAGAASLVASLLSIPAGRDGYHGRIAAWIQERILPALPSGSGREAALLLAASGPRLSGLPTRAVEWEGDRYRLDFASAELRRLERVREKQNGVALDLPLRFATIAQLLIQPELTGETARKATAALDEAVALLPLTGDRPHVDGEGQSAPDLLREALRQLKEADRRRDLRSARRLGMTLLRAAEWMLGETLVSLAYSFDLGDSNSRALIAGDPARRHDFGLALEERERRRVPWTLAVRETWTVPWHLVGSVLSLDVALAPVALRRLSMDRMPREPVLRVAEQNAFAATVALMDPGALTDEDAALIAGATTRGHARLAALADGREQVDTIVRAISLDGWRARALAWTVTHQPDRAASLLSSVEFLALGGAEPASLDAWGTYAFRTAGCLCVRLSGVGYWRRWSGVPLLGLPLSLVADLPLRVASLLHNLQLPAALAKPVLWGAMQEFIDAASPTDSNDWLALAHAVDNMRPERLADYIAATAADGPLIPEQP